MVFSDTSHGDLGWKKFLIAGWAFAECLLLAGVWYGWGSLVFVFKQHHIYSDLCPVELPIESSSADAKASNVSATTERAINSTSSTRSYEICEAQDSMFTLCFTIGSAVFCSSSLLMGHVNYKFGTRVTRLISSVLHSSGCLMLAFVSKEMPWLMFPGLSLVGWGGLPFLVTNMQVPGLFTKGSSSVVGLLCGGFDMSAAIFLFVKLSDTAGFSYKHTFLLVAALQSFTFVSTFCFLPKWHILKREPIDLKGGSAGHCFTIQKSGEINLALGSSQPRKPSQESPSLCCCIRQPLFITHVVWVSVLQLRFFCFIGTINPYLDRVFHGDKEKVSHLTDVFFYTLLGGFFSSFLVGVVYDWQKRLFQNSHSPLRRALMPAVFPLVIGSLLALLLSTLVLIPEPNLLYLTAIVTTLLRSFLYSMAAAFLCARFPSKYFGILYGIVMFSGGIFGGLQFAIFKWADADEKEPLKADMFLLCLVLVSFIHPGLTWYKSRRCRDTELCHKK